MSGKNRSQVRELRVKKQEVKRKLKCNKVQVWKKVLEVKKDHKQVLR